MRPRVILGVLVLLIIVFSALFTWTPAPPSPKFNSVLNEPPTGASSPSVRPRVVLDLFKESMKGLPPDADRQTSHPAASPQAIIATLHAAAAAAAALGNATSLLQDGNAEAAADESITAAKGRRFSFPVRFVFDPKSASQTPPVDAFGEMLISDSAAEKGARAAFRAQFNDAPAAAEQAAAAERALVVRAIRGGGGLHPDSVSISGSGKKLVLCEQQLKNSGKYWNYSTDSCSALNRFKGGLLQHEVGIDELSCAAPEVRRRWLVSPFQNCTTNEEIEGIVPNIFKLPPVFRGDFASKNARSGNGKKSGDSEAGVKKDIVGRYGRFIFYSGWLFKQVRPWRPLPVSTSHILEQSTSATQSNGSSSSRSRRSFYPPYHVNYTSVIDPRIENLVRMENFCINPMGGFISGFNADRYSGHSAARYIRDDTKEQMHLTEYRGLLNYPLDRAAPPTFFDERPVVFFSAQKWASHNAAHVSYSFMSLLGVLKLNAFSASFLDTDLDAAPPKRSEDTQPDPAGPPTGLEEDEFNDAVQNETDSNVLGRHFDLSPEQIKPLIVIVLNYGIQEGTKARFLAFLYQILDLPWTTQLVRVRGKGRNLKKERGTAEREIVSPLIEAIMRKNKYAVPLGGGQPFHSWVLLKQLSRRAVDGDEMCFRRGVAWQNFYAGNLTDVQSRIHANILAFNEQEDRNAASYDFTFQKPATPWRRWMMARYEALLNRCDPVSELRGIENIPFASSISTRKSARGEKAAAAAAAAVTAFPSSSLALFRRPKIFFCVRSSGRSFRFLNLFMDLLRKEIVEGGFASDVVFREIWTGSRAQYLRDLRTSDIFIGTHGGSFASTNLLRPNSVVVEFSGSFAWCLVITGKPYPAGPQGPFCWFDPMSQHKNSSHWVYDVGIKMGAKRAQLFGAVALMDSVKEASCRWFAQNLGLGIRNASARTAANAADRVKQYFDATRPAKRGAAAAAAAIAETGNETITQFRMKVAKRHLPSLIFSSGIPDPKKQEQEEALKAATVLHTDDERRNSQVPEYCRRAEHGVKYSDMSRLQANFNHKQHREANEVRFFLLRFFGVEISIDDADVLAQTMVALLTPQEIPTVSFSGNKSIPAVESKKAELPRLESDAPDLFQFLVSYLVDPDLVVQQKRASGSGSGSVSGRKLRRVVCLRASSPFFSPPSSTPSAAAPAVDGSIPDDFDADGRDSRDTTCLFMPAPTKRDTTTPRVLQMQQKKRRAPWPDK